MDVDSTSPSAEMDQKAPYADIGDDEEPLKKPTDNTTPSTEMEQQTPLTPDSNVADDEGGRTDNMPSPEAAPLKMSADSTEHVTINIGQELVPSNPPAHLHVPTVSEVPTLDDGPSSTAESVTDSEIGRTETMGASEKERQYIEHVLACCEAEDGFDIYQLMAFKSDTKENWKQRIMYYAEVLKAVLCALTQIVGIFVIMHDFAKTGLESKTLCNPPVYDEGAWMAIYNSQLKLLAFLFSSFLAFFSIDQLLSVESGMYKKFQRGANLKLVNVIWLRMGLSVNVIITIAAVYGSFVTVFFSDNSLDMILNSVALFFLVELDDLLVKAEDYATIKKYLEAYEPENTKRMRKESARMATLRGEKCVAAKIYCDLCCIKMVHFGGWLYTLPFDVVRYVTIGACLVLPIFVGYCY